MLPRVRWSGWVGPRSHSLPQEHDREDHLREGGKREREEAANKQNAHRTGHSACRPGVKVQCTDHAQRTRAAPANTACDEMWKVNQNRNPRSAHPLAVVSAGFLRHQCLSEADEEYAKLLQILIAQAKSAKSN